MTAVAMEWDVPIPLRDGSYLRGTLYLPQALVAPTAVVFVLTPYVRQVHHDRGVYFASHGLAFLSVDVRGRGGSEGVFKPFAHEANDGHDIVGWVAAQSYCNGKVAMWGGSYSGFAQWAVAKTHPSQLATLVPTASVHPGIDYPIRNNIPKPYLIQWLTFVSGRTLQDKLFGDREFWTQQFKAWFVSGTPFRQLDKFVGNPSAIFQEWVTHPERGAYWDGFNPEPSDYAGMTMPVLTITGQYDADQFGALTYYRNHLENNPAAQGRHFLIIGPWDHAGTRDPQLSFYGLTMGPASIVDLNQLHLQWYRWVMLGGQRPGFLRKNVAYYVIGDDRWKYADTLAEATAHTLTLYLQSDVSGPSTHDAAVGGLISAMPQGDTSRWYVHDPRDIRDVELDGQVDSTSATDIRYLRARADRQLAYRSASFDQDVEVTGFFKLTLWLSIDQPDSDVRALVYEVAPDGAAVLLGSDAIRARYRETLRESRPLQTDAVLRYDFVGFPFISRKVRRGHRLDLFVMPLHSIHGQKNYQSGGVIADEDAADARIATVCLMHGSDYQSALYVPIGCSESGDDTTIMMAA